MTTDLKAGKECRLCEGKGERIIKWPEWAQARIEKCCDCKGLGWIPAPGDALTRDEAFKLDPSEVEVTYPGGPWVLLSTCKHPASAYEDIFVFRLAPAPQEEKIPKAYAASAGPHEPEEPAAKGESVEELLLPVLEQTLNEIHETVKARIDLVENMQKTTTSSRVFADNLRMVGSVEGMEIARLKIALVVAKYRAIKNAQLEALRKERK